MSDPSFINTDFTQQITSTKAELELYYVNEGMLYFSINKKDFDSSSTINMLCNDLAVVEFGKEEYGRINLGKFSLNGTDKFFFRFHKNDFRIDTSRSIRIDYGKYFYSVSLNELANFSGNKSVYGGKLDIVDEDVYHTANHGALVAVKNEPSLQRLTKQIIEPGSTKEKIAQELLGFVTAYIMYSETEAKGGFEILKRPNEVLMTGSSDCSGMTILYASLLEQTDIDYRLVYYTGHISTAVEGNFPDSNGLSFNADGKKFFLAETTAKDFNIGRSNLTDSLNSSKIKYTQKPGKESEMIKWRNK